MTTTRLPSMPVLPFHRAAIAAKVGLAARVATLILAVGLAAPATATEPSTGEKVKAGAEKAAAATGRAVGKAETAVKKGAKATGDGIQKGVQAANRGVDTAAKKIGVPGAGTPPKTPDPSRQQQQ